MFGKFRNDRQNYDRQNYDRPVYERPRKTADEINAELMEQRTVINGETAIKPYYYLRNGLLHIRYTVDRCVELSKEESTKVKVDLTACPSDKQDVLAKAWSFYTNCVGKTIINDGIKAGYDNMQKIARNYNGFKN